MKHDIAPAEPDYPDTTDLRDVPVAHLALWALCGGILWTPIVWVIVQVWP